MDQQRRHLMCMSCNIPRFFNNLDELKAHYNLHPHLESYSCGKCKLQLMHKTSLIRHIKSQHIENQDSDQDEENDEEETVNLSPHHSQSTGNATDEESVNTDNGNANFDDIGGQQQAPQFDLKTEAALFLMKLRSSGNITHASVKLVLNYVEELLQNILDHVGNETLNFLKDCDVPPEQSQQFLTGPSFKFDKPFEGLESIEDQLNYFCEKFGMVIPEEMYLSYRIENRFDREKKIFLPTQVSETFMFVSAIETLKFIVRNSYLRNLIETEKQSEDGVYRNYKDGTDFKNNAFLQKFPNAIRIVIYTDDLEIANALGSKDTIHKLGAFYFCIQNLPPEESSQLASVFLLALAYAEDLKTKGVYAKIMKCFLDEVKKLMSEEGISVDLPEGGTYIIRACLVCLCADSLAAHSLFGFMSPSAKKFCRLCLISLDDLKTNSAAMGQPRTSELHKQQVADVENGLVPGKMYGILEKSCLIDKMRVPEDSALDAFHDLVGVIQMDIKLALYEFICVQKLFSTRDFNTAVNTFNYGTPDKKNKPSPNFMRRKLIENGHTLKQSGSQTFCLLRIFPFLLCKVQANDKYLKLIHLLQNIVRIIFSFKLRDTDISRLENLVIEHNTLFHQLFVEPGDEPVENADELGEENEDGESDDEEEVESGEENDQDAAQEEARGNRSRLQSKRLKKGINKMHHLMHYSQQMREKGPLIRLWCAKFEGRHRIFRKHSGVQSNFKNPPKTMARMFQMATLAPTLEKTKQRESQVQIMGADIGLVCHSTYRELLLFKGLQEQDQVKVAQSVEVCGLVYQPGLCVVLTGGTEWRPLFGLITEVLVLKNGAEWTRIVLAVSPCASQGRSSMYNCHSISNDFSAQVSLVERDELLHHRPIAPWTSTQPTQSSNLYLYPRELHF